MLRWTSTIVTRLKRYLFILAAAYFLLIGGAYYYQLFAVRVFQHVFATALLGVWLLLRLVRRRGLPETPLNPLLYLCVAVWFASALASADPRMALENVWFPLTNLLLFFVMVDLLQSGGEGLLVDTQFLLAALVIILAAAQFGSWLFGWGFGTPRLGWASVLGGDLPLPLVPPRLFVPLGVSTWLAAYTAPLAVLAGAWGWAARKRGTRRGFLVFAILLIAIMLLTSSRGGWISLGAGAAVFAGLQLLRDSRLRQLARRYAIPLLVALAALVAVAVFALLRLSADPGHSTGDILRFDLWRGAGEIIRDHPILGVGPGEFGHVYRAYREPDFPDNRFSTAHNLYLNTLAETGIVGGLVGLALGLVLLRTWWRRWNEVDSPAQQARLSGAFAALVGVGVQSFFDTFTSPPLVLLALLLVAYCITPRLKVELRSTLPPLRGSRPAAAAALILLLGYGVGLLRSDQAQAAFNASVNSGSLDAAQQAQALDPGLRLYDLQVAYLTGIQDDPAQAIPLYEKALALEPTWDVGWINLAALYERAGSADQALAALLRADSIDHSNGAILHWARLAEAAASASPDAVLDAYRRYLWTASSFPPSSFFIETPLRRQTLDAYIQAQTLFDFRYRLVAEFYPEERAALVPANPISADGWWVVGEYALTVEGDAAKAERAFSTALVDKSNSFLGDYYASRARARLTSNPSGALRDLRIAELVGTYYESPNAIRAQMVASTDEYRRLLAAAVPPRVVDQNFEGVIFGGRVAGFDRLPEMRLPGPGHSVMRPWYDLAASYLADGDTAGAANVYRAILDRAPEEAEARNALANLAGSAGS